MTLVGPPGLQGLLDSMTAFTNRKYPELKVIEVGQPMMVTKRLSSGDVEQIDLGHFVIHVKVFFLDPIHTP